MKLWKLMMAGIVALGLAGAVVTAEPATVTAQASDNITIDGKFSDWDNVHLTEGYNGYMALASGGKYVDVYVKMKNAQVPGHGDYIITIGGKTYHAWFDDIGNVSKGDVKSFTLTGGSDYDGHQYGDVGTGYASNDGSHNIAEFRLDLTKFGLSKSADGEEVGITNSNIGSDAATTKVDAIENDTDSTAKAPTSSTGVVDGKADSSSKDTTTTDTNASNDNDNLNIKIDGKFLDWKHVTLTEGYNGYTAMVSDGDYVYIYVKMKYGQVPGYGDYNFDIGGKKVYVWSDNIPSSQSDGDVKAVTFTGGDYNEGHQYGTVGTGYVSQDGSHSIAEFKVDLSKFKISNMTGQTITMYNPNIGNEKVTVAGGSTGPYIISGIGVVIAGLGYWRFRKAGKLKREKEQTAGK